MPGWRHGRCPILPYRGGLFAARRPHDCATSCMPLVRAGVPLRKPPPLKMDRACRVGGVGTTGKRSPMTSSVQSIAALSCGLPARSAADAGGIAAHRDRGAVSVATSGRAADASRLRPAALPAPVAAWLGLLRLEQLFVIKGSPTPAGVDRASPPTVPLGVMTGGATVAALARRVPLRVSSDRPGWHASGRPALALIFPATSMPERRPGAAGGRRRRRSG